MNKISLKAKLITGLIAGGLLLSTTSFAFAETPLPSTTTPPSSAVETVPPKVVYKTAKLESELKLAVSANIITQAESDQILAYVTSKLTTGVKPEKPAKGIKRVKPDLLKELVAQNILTQAKADALQASRETQRIALRQKALEARISGFVTDKTITQDQATKVIAALNAYEAVIKATREKVSSMTATERKAYLDEQKANLVNPLKTLVASGTITQIQAYKLASVFQKRHDRACKNRGPKPAKAPTPSTSVS